jgi:hypothetical protein
MLIPTDIASPRIALVEQRVAEPRVLEVPGAIRAEIACIGIAAEGRPGIRIAISAGSRDINTLFRP